MKVVCLWGYFGGDIEEFVRSNLPQGVHLVFPRTEEETLEEIRDADVLLAHWVPARLIEGAEKLRLIQTAAAGADAIDYRAAAEKGITVATSSGCNASATAEHAMLLMLALVRRLPQEHNRVTGGEWKTWGEKYEGYELLDKTLGIIGLGKIGVELTKRAKAFGMRILAVKKHPESRGNLKQELGLEFLGGLDSIDYVLENSDFVVVCVPLTEETTEMIGEREINLMKRTAYLINVSRGKAINEKALTKALKEGRIAGAGLDVFYDYLPEPDNPLLKLDNVVLTPHMGGWTKESRHRCLKFALENVWRFYRGEPVKNQVRPHLGY
ncbi:MAG: NAD(P)-dependent oxidoreductase [Candidatus Freyarchaeota archaeon]|nr:2-hydroxyacid dehydrogenase [Candidatus Freyarchaeota archaeon]